MKALFFVGIMSILLGLFGCRDKGTQMHIRIQNKSVKVIDHFWLGAGSGSGGRSSRAFGEIKVGETTRYASLDAHTATYRKFNFTTADNIQYSVIISPDELELGYYTYAITINGNEAGLQIITEQAP